MPGADMFAVSPCHRLDCNTASVPERNSKLLSNRRQVCVVADDDWHMTAQLSCLQADEQIVQAVVHFADHEGDPFDLVVIEHAPVHVVALG